MAKKRDFSEWSKTELVREIKKIEKRKKYGIVWEDKPEKVATLCKEKLPILDEDAKKEIKTGNGQSFNILIEGDNYHALSVLNYTHKGRVDVIYIDPPYNTGNKDFKYNDNWVDSEDSYRHSKWLSFMEKRLKLAKNLLKTSGVIFISIDDIEQAQLKLLCDEIFGDANFITNIIWQSKTGSSDAKTIDTVTEYILVYAKNKKNAKFLQNTGAHELKRYRCKDKYEKERGPHYTDNLDRGGLRYHDSLNYPIKCPDGSVTYPNGRTKHENDGWTWKWGKDKLEWGIKNDFIVFKKSKTKKSGWAVYYKNYLLVDNEGKKRVRSAPYKNVIYDLKTGDGARNIKEVFGYHIFKYSKPYALILRLLQTVNIPKDGVVVDFMAGSGTTGQAVLELNKEDKSARRFILCTNNEDNNGDGLKICTDICYPRVKKVIENIEKESKEKLVSNGPAGLKYFKTEFVDAEPTDRNKRKMVDKSTEMLCLKEDCFEEVKTGKEYKIFKNPKDKYLGIIYDDEGIEPFKKEVEKLKKQFAVYVFSLDESAREEEFEEVAESVELKPIPAVILNIMLKALSD